MNLMMTYISKNTSSDYSNNSYYNNSLELTRVLHPIGQGGFYTETFNDSFNDVFKMAYDCGSETCSPHDIISYLKKYIPKKKINIDAVFISHLHDDHSQITEQALHQIVNDNQFPLFLFSFYSPVLGASCKKPANSLATKIDSDIL